MFIKYLLNILILLSIVNSQTSRDVDRLLRSAGISRSQAEDVIKKEIGSSLEPRSERKIAKNSQGLSTNQDVNLTSKPINNMDSKFSKLVPVWDPPAVEFNKNKNTTYTFNDTTYFWNGKGWLLKNQIPKKQEDKKSPYFGYDVFNETPEYFQDLNFSSIDPNYIVGPGDEVIIMLWGQTEINVPYIVSKEGYLFIDNLGQVFVNGLTLEKLDKKLFKLFKKVYSSLDDSNGPPSTFLDISLGSTLNRPLRVYVTGEVKTAGAYDMNNSTTLFTSLFYFGGPKENGSLRDIRLIRQGEDIGSIDFYDFLLSGKKSNDIKLQRNDVIFFPPRGKTVRVEGEVGRPFIFELKNDENLKNVIDMAGGLLSTTYLDRLQIDRLVSPKDRNADESMKIIDVNLNEQLKEGANFEINDGDRLYFSRIYKNFQNKIEIKGSVFRKGTYALVKNMKISDLIKKAGGPLGDAYTKIAYLTRTNEDYTKSIIDIDLGKALLGEVKNNIVLKNNDILEIYNSSDMMWRDNVSIDGHVLRPGTKQYRTGMSIFDLIFQGGGFENEMHRKNTYFERAEYSTLNPDGVTYGFTTFNLDSVLVGKGIANNLLKMGDKIRIYSKAEVIGKLGKNISAVGFVKRPGSYILFDNMNLSDLLFMAGGFDDPEHISKTHLDRADIIRLNDDFDTKKIIAFNINDILNGKNVNDIALKNDDVVRIYPKTFFKNKKYVTIDGIVSKPGQYELKDEMNLSNLILEAGGLSTVSNAYRVEIASLIYDKENIDEYAEIQTYDFIKNVQKLIDDKENDVFLRPFDVVTLRADPFFNLQKTVSITGNVYFPGDYVVRNSEEYISDIIERAGGLTPEGNPLASTFSRDGKLIRLSFTKLLRNPRSKTNIRIKPGDVINIGSYENLVTVSGEVYNPGNYQFLNGMSFRSYIENAGGFNENADKFKTYIVHPNGTSDRYSLLNRSPKIYNGSEVIVVAKTESMPFNFTEYVTNLTSIWADLTQAYLVILAAARL